jgi:hypothetical protein
MGVLLVPAISQDCERVAIDDDPYSSLQLSANIGATPPFSCSFNSTMEDGRWRWLWCTEQHHQYDRTSFVRMDLI